jgi:hypothetical protein
MAAATVVLCLGRPRDAEGSRRPSAANRTVFVTWLPLAIAGIVLVWRREVHATMRGAAPLRLLARLA